MGEAAEAPRLRRQVSPSRSQERRSEVRGVTSLPYGSAGSPARGSEAPDGTRSLVPSAATATHYCVASIGNSERYVPASAISGRGPGAPRKPTIDRASCFPPWERRVWADFDFGRRHRVPCKARRRRSARLIRGADLLRFHAARSPRAPGRGMARPCAATRLLVAFLRPRPSLPWRAPVATAALRRALGVTTSRLARELRHAAEALSVQGDRFRIVSLYPPSVPGLTSRLGSDLVRASWRSPSRGRCAPASRSSSSPISIRRSIARASTRLRRRATAGACIVRGGDSSTSTP